MSTSKKRSTHLSFAAIDHLVVTSLRCICVCCLAILFLLLAGNVFVRYFPVTAFYWFDEVVEWTFAWMIFMGAAALWARNEHFKRCWLTERYAGRPAGHLVAFIIELLCLFFLIIFFYQAAKLTCLARDWTPVFNVPRRCLYICMPISGGIMVFYSLANCLREIKGLIPPVKPGERQQQSTLADEHNISASL